ncbi:hypothetical protein ACET3X_008131 [Alternaria dauci]|uniref:Uncharacterized protein n=1 Tax=Alternaria dauci TaxID=48095 RepID=A0ABR3U9Z8_9PLEO
MPAQAISPSPATKQKRDSNSSQAPTSDAHSKVPQSEQQETEEEKSFMLATRKALEQALGKEALEAHEEILAKEKESTEQYILDLEAAVKQQYGTPIVHDILIQDQLAILKVKAEGHDEAAKTEIKLLRESNAKLAEEKTTLGRCVRLLTDESIVLKRQHEGASAEIQILHEHNATLAKDNTALLRKITLLEDEKGTPVANQQEEAFKTEIKRLREHNTKFANENTALVRSVALLNADKDNLRAEISALTQDVCDQKELYKKMHGSEEGIKDVALRQKKSRQKLKQRNGRLIKENTNLSRKVVELETGGSSELLAARQRIQELHDQVKELEQGFHQRGEQLIELSRESMSKDKINMQKKAAVEARDLLQTHMSGMFKNYRNLYNKNTALLDKLVSVAGVGRLGKAKTAFRQEMKLLKGQPLEEFTVLSSRNTVEKFNRMSSNFQFIDGGQVPTVEAVQIALQLLQSEIESLTASTKDLPQEINELRNQVLDIGHQLAPATFSKAFSSTIHNLTTDSKAAVHTKVEEVLKSRDLRDKVSDHIIKQMETEKMQKVLEDYAKKAVSSQLTNDIFDSLRYMVDEAFDDINKKIDKNEEGIAAKMEALSKEMARQRE